MPRPLRLEHPGALWHVNNRGVERRDIFVERRDIVLEDRDRLSFLGLMGETVATYRWQIHAYVLMTNHFHLLVETPEPTLSRGAQFLTGEYADSFNECYGLVGHLFQGRFKSQLVEKEGYLLELTLHRAQSRSRADGRAP